MAIPVTKLKVAMLPSVRLRNRENLPTSPGVYFLVSDNGMVVYVGKATKSIKERWAGHNVLWRLEDEDLYSVHYLVSPVSYIDDLEGYFIQTLKPRLNRASVPIKDISVIQSLTYKGVESSDTKEDINHHPQVLYALSKDFVTVRAVSHELISLITSKAKRATPLDWALDLSSSMGVLSEIDVSALMSLGISVKEIDEMLAKWKAELHKVFPKGDLDGFTVQCCLSASRIATSLTVGGMIKEINEKTFKEIVTLSKYMFWIQCCLRVHLKVWKHVTKAAIKGLDILDEAVEQDPWD